MTSAPTIEPAQEPDKLLSRRTALPAALLGMVTQIAGYRENGLRLSGSIEIASLVVPLVIGFDGPFQIALDRPPSPADRITSFAAGLHAGHVVIDSAGSAECIQINFTPLGAARFFAVPLSKLAGRLVALDDLGDRELATLRQKLGEERDWARRLDRAERFVIDRLARAPRLDPAIGRAFDRLTAEGGALRIADLAAELDWSRKHLAQRFVEKFGLAPKAIARVVRFNGAVALARAARRADWADIAFACGYADQAHLTREFSEFAGASPTRWHATAA